MSKSDDALLKQCRDRFKLGMDADHDQREREKQALRMYALDQWDDAILQSRKAQNAVGNIPATPARPCLVVDKLREPVAQVVNQERESDLAVELVPADDFGAIAPPMDPAEVELREGLIRRIQRESESASARTWAFERAVVCGRGYYAINTRYLDGKTFDQEVYCRRLYNQMGVVLDPAHEEPDGSDAEWGFTFTVLSYDAYKSTYPTAQGAKNKLAEGCTDGEWSALMDQAPEWFTQDGEDRYVRVADHWYTERKSRELCELPAPVTVTRPDGTTETTSTVWKDEYELPEGVKPKDERIVVTKSIRYCQIDGCQILDKTDWPSPYVPIIKIVGNEIPPHDQKRLTDGMVNKSAIESQRGINYMASKLTEEVGLSTPTPVLAAEGTLDGYEEWWNQSSTRVFSHLPYKTVDLEGRPAPAPHRPDKTPQIGPIAQGLEMFIQSVQSSTGVNNPQMGKPSRYSETWRGTQALINQSTRGTSNYMDNFTRSVRHEGRIMNSLLYPIYGSRPGRIARIVNGDDDAETVMIGQPFTMQDNGQGGERPVPAPGASPQQEGVRQYVLTEQGGKSNVAVKVTKGYDTRRQEEAAMYGELLTQNPALMTWFGDVFFRNQDTPGSKEAAERVEVMLDPKILAMLEQKKGGQAAIPPHALQQMQQMQQQLQQVTQAAQQMQQELQSRTQEATVKAQSDQEIARIRADVEVQLAQIKLQMEIELAHIKAGSQVQTQQLKDESALIRQGLEHQQEMETEILAANLAPEPTMEQV